MILLSNEFRKQIYSIRFKIYSIIQLNNKIYNLMKNIKINKQIILLTKFQTRNLQRINKKLSFNKILLNNNNKIAK